MYFFITIQFIQHKLYLSTADLSLAVYQVRCFLNLYKQEYQDVNFLYIAFADLITLLKKMSFSRIHLSPIKTD